MNHVITAHTPLPPQALRFRSLLGHEALSTLYEFKVELVADHASLDMKSLLGKPITLEIETQPMSRRYLDGHVMRCELTGREANTPRSYIYTATLRPWLWYLTQTTDCRIFQHKNVVDILQKVFARYGFPVEKRLSDSYREWEYCVQYQESDFDFVSRLMEQEGIYYYFRHEMGQHSLVLADDMSSHDALPDYPVLPYLPPDRVVLPEEEGITQWHSAEEIRIGSYAVDDYDFKKPKADLSQLLNSPLNEDHGDYQKYIWQAGYIDAEQGDHYARVRLEEEQAEHARVQASSKVRGIAPGYLFTLKNCPRQAENREYLIVGAHYDFKESGYSTGSHDSSYDTDFLVQPSALPYRARCSTPVPKATGPQTAVVVGPSGQEIWTDKYGRVKLQFRWDRYGKSNENSSCWVRVSDAWAGSTYGGIYIPRIGQEVVVDFLNGQLDRPLITGRIYNADQMPPFGLPTSATQTGFVTRSLPGGTPSNANIFRFEDRMGAEQVKLHAERNYDVSVEHDASNAVANKYLVQVGFMQLPPESQQSPLPRLKQATTTSHQDGASTQASSPQPRQEAPPSPPSFPQNVISAIQKIADAIGSVSAKVYSLTVQGLSATAVFGDQSGVVTGNASSVVNGNQFSDVNGNNSSFVNGNNSSVINGNDVGLTNGNSTSTVVGDSVSNVEGNSTSLVVGDSNSTVEGDSYSQVDGDSTSIVAADTNSEVGGNTSSQVGGDTSSIVGGSTFSLIGALAQSITPVTLGLTGEATALTGAAVTLKGADVTLLGSGTSMTGSNVSTTGSAVASTGSNVSTTGSNVSTIGSNVSIIGVTMNMVGLEVKF